MLGRLVLRESDQPLGRGDDVEAVLAEAASEAPFEAFGVTASSDGGATLERLGSSGLARAGAARSGRGGPRARADARARGAQLRRSVAQGRRGPLGLLSHGQRVALEEGAPERLRVPSGSHLRLAYDGDRAPVLAVKIQEMFGLADTPTVAGAREGAAAPARAQRPAPAGHRRPRELLSTTYAQVRKDLGAVSQASLA